MNFNEYHLVDSYARKMIDLRDHESEIKRAFRYVPFIHYGIKAHADYFEFTTPHPLDLPDFFGPFQSWRTASVASVEQYRC
ncbi:hypothetical protein, partial [Burkholderia gladioli]|uniref:hypothetical protein n=1 Tax=Burkholderia gladioli TaxID=28095 RepID=UPI002FE249F6